MQKILKHGYLITFIITLIVHGFLWLKIPEKNTKVQPVRPLIVRTLRTVGDKDSTKKAIKLKDRHAGKKRPDPITQSGKKSKLSLSDLSQKSARPSARDLTRDSGINSMFMNKERMRSFLKNSTSQTAAQRLLKELGENDINVKFDLPKGVKLDELNKAELQFYSFQRRTAMNYVNTFYNQLDDFNKKNPHLKFPIVDSAETMTGRVTYDLNGNVVRIQMMRWTDEEKLQEFFLSVLKKLNKLPNPPKAIVHNGEFTIFYTLNIRI